MQGGQQPQHQLGNRPENTQVHNFGCIQWGPQQRFPFWSGIHRIAVCDIATGCQIQILRINLNRDPALCFIPQSSLDQDRLDTGRIIGLHLSINQLGIVVFPVRRQESSEVLNVHTGILKRAAVFLDLLCVELFNDFRSSKHLVIYALVILQKANPQIAILAGVFGIFQRNPDRPQ